MCGIFGIITLNNRLVRNAVLRQILKNLAKSSQARGRNATGYAFTSDEGVNIFKHNVCASQFIELKNYKTVVRTAIANKNLNSIIGHTRQQTQGCHTNPDNNHPIKTGSIVGVHNGMISNDYMLFQDLEHKSNKEIKRIAQVDSEIIFSLINFYAKTNKFPTSVNGVKLLGHVPNPTSKAIAKMAGEIKGSFACASVDADNPKVTWLFKGNGQLSVLHYKQEGVVLFASIESYITDAVKLFGFSEPKEIKIGTHSGICINSKDNSFDSFELEKGIDNTWNSSCRSL